MQGRTAARAQRRGFSSLSSRTASSSPPRAYSEKWRGGQRPGASWYTVGGRHADESSSCAVVLICLLRVPEVYLEPNSRSHATVLDYHAHVPGFSEQPLSIDALASAVCDSIANGRWAPFVPHLAHYQHPRPHVSRSSLTRSMLCWTRQSVTFPALIQPCSESPWPFQVRNTPLFLSLIHI